jgi:hypothetical protein
MMSLPCRAATNDNPLAWPAATRESRPWSYWWWMGSAVDKTNLTRELQRYSAAGWGGVHIIPIYGAKGWEKQFIPYLSPAWMEMLRHTVTEAARLDMGVDMTTGTGWCFGGPNVSDTDANATAVCRAISVAAGEKLPGRFDRTTTQALVAFPAEGASVDLTGKILPDGTVDWTATGGPWKVYAVSQKPSGQKVKRPSLGGEGPMLNLIYADAMPRYLKRFEDAFAAYDGPKPRAMYHDSYEYRSDWSPDFFAQFSARRGYRLQDELPALFGKEEDEHTARVKCDYRETISDIMAEQSLPAWTQWAHRRGFITRNEAHGSPGNWLDLYAASDVPETEMFNLDRNILVSKFASSAAHTTGKKLVGAETGTWLAEHFTEKLADVKYLLDDLFLSGVNHVLFHGTCYSPDEAGWPGWLFYASTEMNPRNAIWHDVPALAGYITRCQSVLQAGQPDHDVLVYWPIHDLWQNPKGMCRNLNVHARDWFEDQPIGRVSASLWRKGYSFDYLSDRQLASAKISDGKVQLAGGSYRVIVVPECRVIPLPALQQLAALAQAGAEIVIENRLPGDVPGWSQLSARREALAKLLKSIPTTSSRWGQGNIRIGDLESALAQTAAQREPMADLPGLHFIRRTTESGRYYFIANRGPNTIEQWLPLAAKAEAVVIMNPLDGQTGVGLTRIQGNSTAVKVQIPAGGSIILRTMTDGKNTGQPWQYWQKTGVATEIAGQWKVDFLQGGPELPATLETTRLASWTELGGAAAQRFAGSARYQVTFAAPVGAGPWMLDLGQVCQSARVRLNGKDLGTLLTPPFWVKVEGLKPTDNLLEVEVTSTSANRIRDLDQRKVKWHDFYDIGFVNLNYKPFDASAWPLADCGLLGPVRLLEVQADNRP